MKLIVVPLSIMFTVVLLSQMGVGLGSTAEYGTGTISLSGQYDYLYDADGIAKLNSTTLEPVNASEKIVITASASSGYALFYNDTDFIHTYYSLHTEPDELSPIPYNELGRSSSSGGGAETEVNVSDSFAFIAIVVGIIALVAIVGFQLFGSGESETSVTVIVLFTGLLSFWTILSFGGFALIVSIPLFGPILYFLLTFMYSLGCFRWLTGGASSE